MVAWSEAVVSIFVNFFVDAGRLDMCAECIKRHFVWPASGTGKQSVAVVDRVVRVLMLDRITISRANMELLQYVKILLDESGRVLACRSARLVAVVDQWPS